MKCYVERQESQHSENTLLVNGINSNSFKCTNKHMRGYFLSIWKISRRGKFVWNSHFTHFRMEKVWLLPYKFVIPNKLKVNSKLYVFIPLINMFQNVLVLTRNVSFVKRKKRQLYICSLNVSRSTQQHSGGKWKIIPTPSPTIQ